MVAKGMSISHGAAMVVYAAGREKAEFLTSKFMNLDFEETFYIMPDNLWGEFKIHALRHIPVENSLMRFELAPSKEETIGWTHEDWKDLLDEFIETLDSLRHVRYKDKKGKWKEMDVKPTNIKNSQYAAFLHLNTDNSHLHFLVNRIDEDGNLNDDTFLMNRCFMAAQIINERRGWKNTLERSKEIKANIKSTTYDVLRQLDTFTWSDFIKAMKDQGIVINPKYDSNTKVVNYKVYMEGCRNKYNASDIDRALTAAHIEKTWKKLHEENEDIARHLNLTATKFNATRKIQGKEETVGPEISNNDTNDDYGHYSYRFGFHKCEFQMKKSIESLIRDEISKTIITETTEAKDSGELDAEEYISFLKNDIDYEATFKIAAMLFVGYVDGATAISNSIGGGGGSSTIGWRKNKDDEDEERWARRCAHQSVKMCKPWHMGRKRGRGR